MTPTVIKHFSDAELQRHVLTLTIIPQYVAKELFDRFSEFVDNPPSRYEEEE